MNTPIKTEADAQSFFFELHQTNRLFHPEDSPFNIIRTSTGERLFSDDEARLMRLRIEEVYAVMDDPCDYILALVYPESDRS